MAKMGRPQKEISEKLFENLCGIQCTEVEMCAILECSEDTLNRWCKRTYGETFAEIYKKRAQPEKQACEERNYDLQKRTLLWLFSLANNISGRKM